MKIVKHSGNIVEFNRNKLRNSLLKSGAGKFVVDDVLNSIDKEIYNGISTKNINKLAFRLLKKSSKAHAARYNMRAAIQMLGPAGFFFEKFIARIFLADEYLVQMNLQLQGKCVSHEVDIVVKKNNRIDMIECKFHSSRDNNSDVKVPMYILSRFNDLERKNYELFSLSEQISGCIIVTNNRFTADAIAFAKCSGIQLLSWDYPEKNNLRNRIDENQLYPVTCLTTLSLAEKDKLLVSDILLASDLMGNVELLEKIGISSKRVKNILKEVSDLCKYI